MRTGGEKQEAEGRKGGKMAIERQLVAEWTGRILNKQKKCSNDWNINRYGKNDRDLKHKKTNDQINAKMAEKGDGIIKKERRREIFYIINNYQTVKSIKTRTVQKKF